MRLMPKYYDSQGKEVTHWVETLMEKLKAAESLEIEVLRLKTEVKRLKKLKKVIT